MGDASRDGAPTVSRGLRFLLRWLKSGLTVRPMPKHTAPRYVAAETVICIPGREEDGPGAAAFFACTVETLATGAKRITAERRIARPTTGRRVRA